MDRPGTICLHLVAGIALAWLPPAGAGEPARLWRGFTAPFEALQRERPRATGDDCVERLAAEIDWLEHHLDTHGSIVAKQPDVWGQSRLMRHRHEYEEQLRAQLGQFAERSSAAVRRSDQAYLGMALALQAASGRRRGAADVAVPDATGSASVITSIQGLLPSGNEPVGRSEPVVIARTAPFAVPAAPSGLQFSGEPLALEPTLHLDHLSRYLAHLHELRRVNEGDDTADSPGYALNLLRIPVSILPGARTRKGHGAEITLTAEPCLGPDLLPTTFRTLVINDLVDIIAPALTWCVNDPESLAWATTITRGAGDAPPVDGEPVAAGPGRPGPVTTAPLLLPSPLPAAPTPRSPREAVAADGVVPGLPAPSSRTDARQGVLAAMQALSARLPTLTAAAPPAVKTRRARLPIPCSQLADVAGIGQIAILVRDTQAALVNHPASRPCIQYLDVRGYLAEELEAAADLLARPEQRAVWDELPGWQLADLVRSRRAAALAAVRCRFLAGLGEPAAGAPPRPHPAADACCGPEHSFAPVCRTTTAVLAWAILVESALLDERLATDMREAAAARGRIAAGGGCSGPFFGPDPPAEARAAFADYVRCRWPIRVFALDPVGEEQNVEDAFARRRELQIAAAIATASGRMNAQAMERYTRRLETDLATVALNKTAFGFAHGPDTFGWRFQPRVQSPPTRGTLATLTETVRGGPTTDGDLAQRCLEPGQRECVAIVVMPSFVPYVTLDVRTNWYPLAHPRATEQSLRRTMLLSRSVKAMQAGAVACSQCAHRYRDGEVARLVRRVEQLERELPLQTLEAQIPAENTAGGFELFNTGVTDLAPELVGWYGAPGIDPTSTTTLFLVGKGFSVHDTSVIAGGRPARFTLVSREVLRVEIPPGVRPLGADAAGGGSGGCQGSGPAGGPCGQEAVGLPSPSADAAPGIDGCDRRAVVDIHLATPYGVTGHLLVPVARRPERPDAVALPTFVADCSVGLTFTVAKTAGSRTEAARIDEFFATTCDSLSIRVPESFIAPPKAELRFTLRDDAIGTTAALFSVSDPFFDARHARYVIAGGDLRNLVGDTSRPATDKTLRGGLKPWLDELVSRGLLAAEGEAFTGTLTVTIVAGQQEVPVAGSVAVTATRRGRTVVEPRPEPASAAAP